KLSTVSYSRSMPPSEACRSKCSSRTLGETRCRIRASRLRRYPYRVLCCFSGRESSRSPGRDGRGRSLAPPPDLAPPQRERDPVLLEQPPDRAVHVRAHVVDAVLGIRDPEAQLELDAVVAEVHEP